MTRGRYTWRIIGFIFKGLCTALIVGVFGLLFWRIIDSKIDPKEIKGITPNETLCSAYTENEEKLTIFTQEQQIFTRAEHNEGYFAVTEAHFIKEAEQLQFTLRYNNSTIEHLVTDFSLNRLPSREEELYDVTVLIAYDLTPENDEDNDGNDPESVRFERFYPSDMSKAQKTVYNYRKFTFDSIEITDDVLAVYVDIYYVGHIAYDEDAYGALLLYDYATTTEYRSLKNSERKLIKAYIKDN